MDNAPVGRQFLVAPNVVLVGRRMLVWLATFGLAASPASDVLASLIGGRNGEALSYAFFTLLIIYLGVSAERIKTFLGE
jgi:hypothetical protein